MEGDLPIVTGKAIVPIAVHTITDMAVALTEDLVDLTLGCKSLVNPKRGG